ncbi:6808_t:CDS:2 [Ambispora gerdemannii]|uniref:6808_t:CDS:1 n=1 Tax=Ambispora gerdemannii TaxID=144530 RepID=A0A9N8Z9H2_9GLOM|nr:6808_t:CDS:2 [Ambispora gerdemannii]
MDDGERFRVDIELDWTIALKRLSPTITTASISFIATTSSSISLQKLAPEILESIFIHLSTPCTVAPVCRLFHLIVAFSKSFKRRWLRQWLNPKLPDAFMPTYSDLCRAIESKTPINILVEIINLQILGKRPLCSSKGGYVTRLVDAAYAHTDRKILIPFLIKKGMRLEVYIHNHTTHDFELTEGGNEIEKKTTKDYFSVLVFARQNSFEFYNQLLAAKKYFNETELAFGIVLHQRFDVADALSLQMQHTLDVLDECVDRQYTNGIAWAFARGLGDAQKRNPLYLRICVEKADVEAVRTLILNGALINISPSSHQNNADSFGSTSFLEFSLQCYFSYHKEKETRKARIEIIKLFLMSNADPNADCGRPLALTVTNYNWELTRLLLSFGADPNRDNQLALKIAMDLGYKDMASTLYQIIKDRSAEHDDNHADENGNNNKRDSTLLKAVRKMTHSLEKMRIPGRRKSEKIILEIINMAEPRVSFDKKESIIAASSTSTVPVSCQHKRVMPKRKATPYVWSNNNHTTTTPKDNEGKGNQGENEDVNIVEK